MKEDAWAMFDNWNIVGIINNGYNSQVCPMGDISTPEALGPLAQC